MGRVLFLLFLVVAIGGARYVFSAAGPPQTFDPFSQLAYTRTVSFSGYDWLVKTSSGKVGPGPNYFSDSADNVWVDPDGRLHLRITRRSRRWYAAEVICQASLGYGSYRFYLDSPVDNLDPSVVLGLFTWSDDPAFDNREIDLEFSRWGSVNNQNAQYVVQPYTLAENVFRFEQPPGLSQSTHSFSWQAGSVAFKGVRGFAAEPVDPADVIEQWTFAGVVPPPGSENPRMNLWLFNGRRPSSNREVEVIINRFEFAPTVVP